MATDFKQKLHSILKGFEATELTGYIPEAGTSGVTIATGFDLGQHNAADIKKLNLPKTLEAKLLPYIGSKDKAKAKTLTITAEEAALIDNAVINSKIENFSKSYKDTFGTEPEKTLDENTRLALASAFFNMGPKMFDKKANPSMFNALKSGDTKQIHTEIADFHRGNVKQPISRRLAEAAIASGFIDASDSAGISKFKDLMASNSKARDAYRQNWANIEIKNKESISPNKLTPQQIEQAVPSQGVAMSPADIRNYRAERDIRNYQGMEPGIKEALGRKEASLVQRIVEGVIPSAQAEELPVRGQPTYDYIPQQAEPQYATMEELLGKRNILSNDLLYPPMP